MYYEGINANAGKIVEEDDAFAYAMDCILKDEDEYEQFEREFGKRFILGSISCRASFLDFAKDLVDWFFSGDWIPRKRDSDE